MSSFPVVLSANLSVSGNKTFTVPAEYAFAVVQVCLIPGKPSVRTGQVFNTSHGVFNFVGYTQNPDNTTGNLKDFPILNLIIKGGESFSLWDGLSPMGGTFTAKVTALCHKKPT